MWLDIAMRDATLMAVLEASKQLLEEVARYLLAENTINSLQRQEVYLRKLECMEIRLVPFVLGCLVID